MSEKKCTDTEKNGEELTMHKEKIHETMRVALLSTLPEEKWERDQGEFERKTRDI